MTARLPNGNAAILDIRKLEDYRLNPSHPRGRHKARVFRETLGLERDDSRWLRDVLLAAAAANEAVQGARYRWGTDWRIDVTVTRQSRSTVVRTVWIVRAGENVPRFVSCWVL